MDAVPVVDLGVPVEQAAESIGRAARNSGFFYVKNHGISEDLLTRQFASSRAFFELPLDQKLALKINDGLRFVQKLLLQSRVITSDRAQVLYVVLELKRYSSWVMPLLTCSRNTYR